MANTIKTASKFLHLAKTLVTIPFIEGIHEMSNEQLKPHGFYHGFYCPHGHRVRHLEDHWCYECVRKIQNNNCGFDINYLNKNYKSRLFMLWNQISVGEWDDCWEVPWLATKRTRFPSYRTLNNSKTNDNVNIHKVIYQCAWGDVGKMFVTRTCKNKNCLNPLHLVSSWNRTFPPKTIHPFCVEFDPAKAMQHAQNQLRDKPIPIIEQQYKNTIQHPLVHKNTPDYDDIQELYYGSYVQEFGKSATKNSE
jgi:hypothetical protein